MYGGGASVGVYSGAYSDMYDDDDDDNDRVTAVSLVVGEDESLSCPCVSRCLIAPLDIDIMTSTAYIIIVMIDMDYRKQRGHQAIANSRYS